MSQPQQKEFVLISPKKNNHEGSTAPRTSSSFLVTCDTPTFLPQNNIYQASFITHQTWGWGCNSQPTSILKHVYAFHHSPIIVYSMCWRCLPPPNNNHYNNIVFSLINSPCGDGCTQQPADLIEPQQYHCGSINPKNSYKMEWIDEKNDFYRGMQYQMDFYFSIFLIPQIQHNIKKTTALMWGGQKMKHESKNAFSPKFNERCYLLSHPFLIQSYFPINPHQTKIK